MSFFAKSLIAASFICALCPAPTAAALHWQEWRIHSSKGFVLCRKDDYDGSLSEYRLALEAARRERADPQVIIDLELDIVQDLVSSHQLKDALTLINHIGSTEIFKYKGSLLEARYWHRVHAIALAQRNVNLAVKSQQAVVRILGNHFAGSSPACLDELHVLQVDLIAGEYWKELLPIVRLFRLQLTRSPIKIAAEKYQSWLQETCATVFVAATDGKHSADQRLVLLSIFPEVCLDKHKLMDMCSALMGADQVRVRMAADRNLINTANSLADNLTADEKRRVIIAHLGIMFWHLDNETYDQEAEDAARSATEGLRAKHPIDFPILIQAQTMYYMILARRGKLEAASTVFDALRIPDDTLKVTMDLGPYSNACTHVAAEYAKRGDEAGVRKQFTRLAELVKSQRLLVVDPHLLQAWDGTEKTLLQEAKNNQKSQ